MKSFIFSRKDYQVLRFHL